MGFSISMSGAYERGERVEKRRQMSKAREQHMAQQGPAPTMHPRDDMPREVDVLIDGDTGEQVRNRVRASAGESGSGIDHDLATMGGDPLVMLDTQQLPGGDFVEYFERYGEDGRPKGTYEVYWDRTDDRQHVARAARSIHSF